MTGVVTVTAGVVAVVTGVGTVWLGVDTVSAGNVGAGDCDRDGVGGVGFTAGEGCDD